MARRTLYVEPTDIPLDALMPILLLGGAGYVAAFILTWMAA
jgi:hypothetical protein